MRTCTKDSISSDSSYGFFGKLTTRADRKGHVPYMGAEVTAGRSGLIFLTKTHRSRLLSSSTIQVHHLPREIPIYKIPIHITRRVPYNHDVIIADSSMENVGKNVGTVMSCKDDLVNCNRSAQ